MPDPTLSSSARLEPWFDDGNVILLARNKYFRVHRSVLSLYSGTCFHVPNPPVPATTRRRISLMDAVVYLDDALDHVAIVLWAMYGASSVCSFPVHHPLVNIPDQLHE